MKMEIGILQSEDLSLGVVPIQPDEQNCNENTTALSDNIPESISSTEAIRDFEDTDNVKTSSQTHVLDISNSETTAAENDANLDLSHGSDSLDKVVPYDESTANNDNDEKAINSGGPHDETDKSDKSEHSKEDRFAYQDSNEDQDNITLHRQSGYQNNIKEPLDCDGILEGDEMRYQEDLQGFLEEQHINKTRDSNADFLKSLWQTKLDVVSHEESETTATASTTCVSDEKGNTQKSSDDKGKTDKLKRKTNNIFKRTSERYFKSAERKCFPPDLSDDDAAPDEDDDNIQNDLLNVNNDDIGSPIPRVAIAVILPSAGARVHALSEDGEINEESSRRRKPLIILDNVGSSEDEEETFEKLDDAPKARMLGNDQSRSELEMPDSVDILREDMKYRKQQTRDPTESGWREKEDTNDRDENVADRSKDTENISMPLDLSSEDSVKDLPSASPNDQAVSDDGPEQMEDNISTTAKPNISWNPSNQTHNVSIQREVKFSYSVRHAHGGGVQHAVHMSTKSKVTGNFPTKPPRRLPPSVRMSRFGHKFSDSDSEEDVFSLTASDIIPPTRRLNDSDRYHPGYGLELEENMQEFYDLENFGNGAGLPMESTYFDNEVIDNMAYAKSENTRNTELSLPPHSHVEYMNTDYVSEVTHHTDHHHHCQGHHHHEVSPHTQGEDNSWHQPHCHHHHHHHHHRCEHGHYHCCHGGHPTDAAVMQSQFRRLKVKSGDHIHPSITNIKASERLALTNDRWDEASNWSSAIPIQSEQGHYDSESMVDGSNNLLKSDMFAFGKVKIDTKSGTGHTKLQEENDYEYISHEESLFLSKLEDDWLNEKIKDIKACEKNAKHDKNYRIASEQTTSGVHAEIESDRIRTKSHQNSILQSPGDTSTCVDFPNKEPTRLASSTSNTQDRAGPMPPLLVAKKQGLEEKREITVNTPSHADGHQRETLHDGQSKENEETKGTTGGKQRNKPALEHSQQQTEPSRANVKEGKQVQTKSDHKNSNQEEKQQRNSSHVDIQKDGKQLSADHNPCSPSLSPSNKIDGTVEKESIKSSKTREPCRPEHVTSGNKDRKQHVHKISRRNNQYIQEQLKSLSTSLYGLGTNGLGTNGSTSSTQSDSESDKESGPTHPDQPLIEELTEGKVTSSLVTKPSGTASSESSKRNSPLKQSEENVDTRTSQQNVSKVSEEKNPSKEGILKSTEGEGTKQIGSAICSLPKDQAYPGRLKYPEHISKPPVAPFPNFPRQPQHHRHHHHHRRPEHIPPPPFNPFGFPFGLLSSVLAKLEQEDPMDLFTKYMQAFGLCPPINHKVIPPSMMALPPACGCGNCKNCRATRTIRNVQTLAESIKREIHDVIPDGNCMFRSIIDQLRMQGEVMWTSMHLRQKAVSYLRENPHQEDGTHLKEFLSVDTCTWDEYLSRMSNDAEWGDNIILRGLAEVTGRNIQIISAFGDVHNQTTVSPISKEPKEDHDILLGHIDDQHYVSLRRDDWYNTWYTKARDYMQKLTGRPLPLLNLEDTSQKILAATEVSSGVDEFSFSPYYHLTFIIKRVLPRRFLKSYSHAAIDEVRRSMPCSSRSSKEPKTLLYGEAVEGLSVELIDKSLFSGDKQAISSYPRPKIVAVSQTFECVEQIIDSKQNSSLKHIEIHTEGVHPGYVRLHSPLFYPQFFPDEVKYIEKVPYVKRKPIESNCSSVKERFTPSFTCKEWPAMCFSSWIERERSSGWPDGECLAKSQSTELLFVPHSHPQSDDPEIEWRICFGPAEEILASSLTKWQKYCFHVLQVLIKFHVEEGNVVQLYYLKTIFFYALEMIPKEKWENQIGLSLLYLLDRTIIAFRNRSLSHYFIPQNNLIDHLDEDICKNVVVKLEAIRQFPVISAILVAEGHGLTSSWVADPIIEDIPRFFKHKNIQRSVQETFVPTIIRDVQNDIAFQFFESAAKSFMEAFTGVSRGLNAIMVPFEAFLHQSLHGIANENQWWFCFFLDLFHKTNSLHCMFHHERGVTLCELLGPEHDAGPFYAIKIPHPLMGSPLCQKRGPVVGFLTELCTRLLSQKAFDEAPIYARILIKVIKKNIANIAASENVNKDTRVSTGSDADDNISQIEKHTKGFPEITQAKNSTYLKHIQITTLNTSLYVAYVLLYECYMYLEQPELFTEYVEDMENLCDAMPSVEAYKTMADIWWKLGSDEKYDEAMTKYRNCSEGYSTSV